MIPVESSNISHLGYDKDAKILHIKFKTGDTWKYHDVSHEAVADLAQAPSIGSHFSKHIRNKHKGEKV